MTSEAKSQADRFAATARALGADEDEAAFRAKLAVIARHKPKEDVPEPQKIARAGKKGQGQTP